MISATIHHNTLTIAFTHIFSSRRSEVVPSLHLNSLYFFFWLSWKQCFKLSSKLWEKGVLFVLHKLSTLPLFVFSTSQFPHVSFQLKGKTLLNSSCKLVTCHGLSPVLQTFFIWKMVMKLNHYRWETSGIKYNWIGRETREILSSGHFLMNKQIFFNIENILFDPIVFS